MVFVVTLVVVNWAQKKSFLSGHNLQKLIICSGLTLLRLKQNHLVLFFLSNDLAFTKMHFSYSKITPLAECKACNVQSKMSRFQLCMVMLKSSKLART